MLDQLIKNEESLQMTSHQDNAESKADPYYQNKDEARDQQTSSHTNRKKFASEEMGEA